MSEGLAAGYQLQTSMNVKQPPIYGVVLLITFIADLVMSEGLAAGYQVRTTSNVSQHLIMQKSTGKFEHNVLSPLSIFSYPLLPLSFASFPLFHLKTK